MRHRLFLFAVALLLTTGCSNSLEVAFDGTETMNTGGNAAVVKVYQLKGDGNFQGVPFSTFWRDEEAALGGELLESPRKVTVYPGESRILEFELVDQTNHIGVAANLRSPDQDGWRYIHPVKEMGDEVVVTVVENKIDVEVERRNAVVRFWDWMRNLVA